jgi:hypothetical protein
MSFVDDFFNSLVKLTTNSGELASRENEHEKNTIKLWLTTS